MTALPVADASALLRRKSRGNHLVARALGCLASKRDALKGGVIPMDDALRIYDSRLKRAAEKGMAVTGASRLLPRLRQSGLERVAVFSVDADDVYVVFFADPAFETLLGTIGLPIDMAKTAEG